MTAQKQTKQFRNLNILFVDDDPAFSRPIALVLHKGFGHNTKLVTTMLQAYTEIRRSNFDIVLLDYKLADGSGLEVLQWMKDHSVDTPVILITGYGCEEVAVEALKRGAYDYVNKMHISLDFIPNLIHSTVERHLVIKQ
jgi:two-component system response regulator HydG